MAALLDGATPSLARGVRLARNATSVVMRPFLNGMSSLTLLLQAPEWRCCEGCRNTNLRSSRNCTKHKQRCPYQDVPEERPASAEMAQLGWTADIIADINQWKETTIFPFPIFPFPDHNRLTEVEMRLIHHVASISYELTAMDANCFTLWTHQIPTIIKIGATHRFVLDALLAFSAMHLSFMYACPLVGNMAYEHRGEALKGLHKAINTFSQETSDAILAASLVLSWQATDW